MTQGDKPTTDTGFRPGRRSFLKVAAGTAAGLVLGVRLDMPARAQEGTAGPAFNAFVSISPDNRVRVLIKHLEMGQGVYTGLATCAAEELDADWEQVICEHAPVDTEKYANLLMGQQGTGGSTAMANSYRQMREAGAGARAMLVAAAAERWQVPSQAITVENGRVSHGDRSVSFGELAAAAARQPAPSAEELNLKTPDAFRLIGRADLPRKDVGKQDGTALYTQDVKLPGMLTAVVAHPPRFGARVRDFDDGAARSRDGVVDVFAIDSGVAVVARDYWTALKAREQLSIRWDESQAEKRGSEQILREYRDLSGQPGAVAEQEGDVERSLEQALQAGSGATELVFEFPYLAHAQMEPMNCVARVDGQSAELWYGCQSATRDQQVVAELVEGRPENVTIHTVYAGGGFGRRANPQSDYVVEAVRIARRMQGQPVKLVWSREDDMTAGYYRPAYVHRLSAAVDDAGMPSALRARVVGQSIMAGTSMAAGMISNGIDHSSLEGLTGLPYSVRQRRVELHTTDVGVPVQWWRSVGNTHTAYSKEVFMDLLARQAGRDPVAYRLELLRDNPKESAVLRLAAKQAGWGSRELPEGWHRGVAVHSSFGSTVAEVAEISMQDEDSFRVDRIVAAIDCGTAVNPDVIRAQVEGAIAYGLSAALGDEVTLTDGVVDQDNFHNYRVLRLPDMPEVEVHIVPSSDAPTGVGEPGTPPVAPAVANALAAATGRTFTRLPLRLA